MDIKRPANLSKDIKDLSYSELGDLTARKGLPSYRTDQLFSYLYKKRISEFSEITVFSKELRAELASEFSIKSFSVESHQISKIDNSEKFLFRLKDDNFIETVYLPTEKRRTVCISCQVGCRMGCTFCATAGDGLIRNLTAGEIIEQLLFLEDLSQKKENSRISNVVFMGMGEPFDNYENVMKAAETISDINGINISSRKITISTCGLIPGLKRYFTEKRKFKLAISMNSPFDDERNTMMPVNRKYPIREIIELAKPHSGGFHNRVTFEYIMMKDNVSREHADEIIRLLGKGKFKLNLIPYNCNDSMMSGESQPSEPETKKFHGYFLDSPLQVMMRNSLGRDIDGACGM
ncbi:MAG: 23S rRNA (adenine(2503)-C(2))-methyltransferase RlmN, partial [Actinomycetia bacterium]|nr:23S rRNA (adenine(2503)-C(2))-methyltransferase RlmN [Actinomycetes bacterium]